jgi:serine/threonine-protein kinase
MSAPVKEGDLLAGKYRVKEVLGTGGMGVVVAAEHVQLAQLVAIKFLLPDACQEPDAVARFLREARAAVQIRSEHVARVTDVGTLEGGAPYTVMEYLRGTDLARTMSSRGPFPIFEAVDFVLQACEAVAEAHALGIVHRDLKPSNLFVAERADGSPLIKVLDFGISKWLGHARVNDDVAASMTATNMMMGSPRYMSPEQVRSSKNVDARTDIWSLGVILYELLTGCPLYPSNTMSEVLAMVVADPPTPLRAKRPDAPADLEHTILRCLEKDPARRIATVAELARSLLPHAPAGARVSVDRIVKILENRTGSQTISVVHHPDDASRTQPTVAAWGAAAEPSRSRRGSPVVAVFVGIGVFASLAVAVVLWLRRGPSADLPHAAPSTASAPTVTTPSASPDLAPLVETSSAPSASAPPPRPLPKPLPTKPRSSPLPKGPTKHESDDIF